jgi:anti-sigma B factor antagonist
MVFMTEDRIIKIVAEDDVAVVSFLVPSVSGVNDIDGAAESLREYVENNKPKALVVDFADVKFFSSQVLGMLVDIWRRLREYDASILICGITPQLSRVFKITNLDRIFEFYEDKTAAMDALAGT